MKWKKFERLTKYIVLSINTVICIYTYMKALCCLLMWNFVVAAPVAASLTPRRWPPWRPEWAARYLPLSGNSPPTYPPLSSTPPPSSPTSNHRCHKSQLRNILPPRSPQIFSPSISLWTSPLQCLFHQSLHRLWKISRPWRGQRLPLTVLLQVRF